MCIITTIVIAYTVPQITLWQWVVELSDIPPSLTVQIEENQGTADVDQQEQWTSKYWIIAVGKQSHKIDPSTITSYAKGGGRWSILCSTIARINLSAMTKLPYTNRGFSEGTVVRGDAYALALQWLSQWTMITTSKTSMQSDIWDQYHQTKHTIFDVYFYKGSNGGVLQWHRAVVFIGTDDQIYILDPIRWLATAKPQLLSEHFEADAYRGYSIYISRISYVPAAEYHTISEYYEINDTVSLTNLVSDGAATMQYAPLSDDVVLTVNQPIKMHDNQQEMIINKWAIIRIKNTTQIVWLKLNFESHPTQKIEAMHTQPELGKLMTPRDL